MCEVVAQRLTLRDSHELCLWCPSNNIWMNVRTICLHLNSNKNTETKKETSFFFTQKIISGLVIFAFLSPHTASERSKFLVRNLFLDLFRNSIRITSCDLNVWQSNEQQWDEIFGNMQEQDSSWATHVHRYKAIAIRPRNAFIVCYFRMWISVWAIVFSLRKEIV